MSRTVDAHQHFWNLRRSEYAWLTPEFGAIRRNFEPDELEPQLAHAGVDATVLVQAENSYADTDYLLEVADERAWVAGVVGWVPLLDPGKASEVLDRYLQHPKFKGVRHLIHDEPDPDWVVQDPVVESLGVLAERGVPFDVVSVLPRHLEHVVTLAERIGNLHMVIDHLSKPPIADRGWEPWASRMAAVAESPNVAAKISGLNTAARWDAWTGEDLKPYVAHALGLFGTNRMMFGSDWPVALLAGDYQQVRRETDVALGAIDDDARDAIYGGTATRFYGL